MLRLFLHLFALLKVVRRFCNDCTEKNSFPTQKGGAMYIRILLYFFVGRVTICNRPVATNAFAKQM